MQKHEIRTVVEQMVVAMGKTPTWMARQLGLEPMYYDKILYLHKVYPRKYRARTAEILGVAESVLFDENDDYARRIEKKEGEK